MAGLEGFKVEGLNKLTRELQALGLEVEDLKDAFESIAAKGAQLAAKYAPRRSGDLAESVRGNRSKNKAVVAAGNARKVPYAGAVNYGWGHRASNYKHGRNASGIRGSARGRFFLQKADEEMRPQALAALDDAIEDKIRKKGLQ